jgi:hypothetical protein
MSTPPNHGFVSDPQRRESQGPASYGPGEDTLRLIASLPAPEGLPNRVQAGLRAAPQASRILFWRSPLVPPGGWMFSGLARGAAAAAIVCVVAGGGWRIYSHVLTIPAARAVLVPGPVTPMKPGGSGFSPAGAWRVPDTLVGPVLKHPVAPTSDVLPSASEVNVVEKMPAQPKPSTVPRKKKAQSRPAAAPLQ